MKILLFSDLHCHNHNQFSTRLENGLNSRFEDCLNIIRQARKICEEREIWAVMLLGDLFHSRTKIDVDVFTLTYRELRKFSEDADLYFLSGNHDQNARVGDVTSLEAFEDLGFVYAEPSDLSFAESSRTFRLIPYQAEVEKFREALIGCSQETILLLHQPIREAIPGATNLTGKNIIFGSDFDNCPSKLIISGDIHKRQALMEGRFQYLGSPLQLTFGDRGEKRGFTILDTETLEMEFVEADAPRFFWFRDTFKEHPSINFDRDFVRFTYRKDNAEVAEFKTKYPRVQFDLVREGKPVLEEKEKSEIIGDDAKLLQAYIDRIGTDLDKERLLAIGLQELSGAVT